jgi:hypothetical protein
MTDDGRSPPASFENAAHLNIGVIPDYSNSFRRFFKAQLQHCFQWIINDVYFIQHYAAVSLNSSYSANAS